VNSALPGEPVPPGQGSATSPAGLSTAGPDPRVPAGAVYTPGQLAAPVVGASTAPPKPNPPTGAEEPRAVPPPRSSALRTIFEALGFERPSRWLIFLILAVVVDAVVIAWLQVQAYNAFYTFSQDFGSFNQSFYTAAFHQQLFYYTSNLAAGTGGTYFSVHFAPFLFLLLPFYALFAAPTTLLIFKAVALALGAFPVYGLAHRRLGSPVWGFGLGVVYLLSPLTMDLAWTTFDMEVFLPVLVLSSIYFLTRRSYVPFLVFWLLSLSVIETIAPLLVIFVIICVLGAFLGPRVLSGAALFRERAVLLTALAVSIGWIALAYVVTTSLDPVGATFGVGYATRYTTLGATSFAGVVPQALLHPNLAAAALQFQGSNKLAYVLLLFGCVAFLPFFGELRYLAPVGGWLVLSLLSNVNSLYAFGSSYLGYVNPFLFAGAIGGLVYLRPLIARAFASDAAASGRGPGSERYRAAGYVASRSALPVVLGIAVIVSVGVGNPLLSSPAASLGSIHFGYPQETAHTEFLQRVIGLIPNNASVLTTAHLFPQVSGRANAYVLPSAELFAGSNTYWGYLNLFINESSFVLLDFTLDGYVSQLMEYFGNYSAFGVLVAAQGVVLLERGWSGGPLASFWTGNQVTLNATGASVAVNPATEQRLPSTTLFFSNHGKVNAPIWSGPGISRIAPGEYQVTLSYQLSGSSSGDVVKFVVSGLPFTVVPTTYLNTSSGHHYNYNFERATTAVVLAQTQLATGSPSAVQTASLVVNISSLESFTTLGSALGGTFALQLYSVTITAVGQVTAFAGG
jgi:uncharacterized membrane protein